MNQRGDGIYFNTAPSHTNYYNVAGNTGLVYFCVKPLVSGIGNTDGNHSSLARRFANS